MIRRFHPWLLLPALLASCDKQRDAQTSGPAATGPAVTKSSPRPRGESQSSAESLRSALTAAREIKSPGERAKALAEVAWNALETDPQLANQALLLLPDESREKTRLLEHLATRLAEQDPAAALAWADSLGTEQGIADAKARIALVLAESEPERAARLLSESGVDGRGFDVAAVQVIERWAARTPADAAAWVLAFPPGAAREAGLKSVISHWAESDSQGVFTWMAGQENDAVRAEITLAMAEALLRKTRDQRARWLEHADPRVKQEIERSYERARRNVGDRDPE